MPPPPPVNPAVASVPPVPKPVHTTPGKRRPRALVRRRARRLRSLRVPLLVLMLLASSLLLPLVLAAFIALGLNPIVAGLSRIYVPRAIGSLLVMLALGAVVAGSVSALSTPAAAWIKQAPAVVHELGYKLRRMTRPLTEVSHAASQSLAGIGVAAPPAVQIA